MRHATSGNPKGNAPSNVNIPLQDGEAERLLRTLRTLVADARRMNERPDMHKPTESLIQKGGVCADEVAMMNRRGQLSKDQVERYRTLRSDLDTLYNNLVSDAI